MSHSAFLSSLLASGGDGRIAVPRGGSVNTYGASPYPRALRAYAASTANDISGDAFDHVAKAVAQWPAGQPLDAGAYADALDAQRERLRAIWGLDAGTAIVFGASGTDLEIAALALARSISGRPVSNVLLGQDEVGSGCVLAAGGRYFADDTALGVAVRKGESIADLQDCQLIALRLRTDDGQPLDADAMEAAIDRAVCHARAGGRHALVHVVHGSKTGLIAPSLQSLDSLRQRHGKAITVVVDACQARIDAAGIRTYLDRQAIVLLTGSKFIGGPPFSGICLVPQVMQPQQPLACGLATMWRRGEWPLDWACCNHLPQAANPGLLLRIEAALFEMERYQTVPIATRQGVAQAFAGAVTRLGERLGTPLVWPALAGDSLHEATLATLDLSMLPGSPDLALTRRWGAVLAARGLRLGQPVKWRRMADGRWAGNLRISLSMPLIAELSRLNRQALDARLLRDMDQIADVLEAAQRPVVA